jgi:hypothetical protein
MPVPPIPVNRYLVPPVQPSLPDDFTAVSQTLTAGLPQTITLTDDLSLTLVVPNGLAHAWRDTDPAALISGSDSEIRPLVDTVLEIRPSQRAPARVLLRRTGTTLASVPLVAGLHRFIPDHGDPTEGVAVELAIISWQLHAGILRGPGDFGSRIDVAWRRANLGSDFFSELPEVPPFLYRLKDLAAAPRLFPRTLENVGLRPIFLRRALKERF